MRIVNNIEGYTVHESNTLVEALSILSDNKTKILFVLNPFGVVIACFSDGDFRRWVLATDNIDLETPVVAIANRDFVWVSEESNNTEIAAQFSDRIQILPIVDEEMRLRSIALPEKRKFSIGPYNVNKESKTLVIAEIGNNHNGDIEEAINLVNSAVKSGADCVKFQMRDLETLYVGGDRGTDSSSDLGTEYVLDLLSRFQLSDADFKKLFAYCERKGIVAICTPFDRVSADKLDALGIYAFKVASADLTNHDLLEYLAAKDKPLLISTGMSTEDEILAAVKLLREKNAMFVLLHCNSTYPCPLEDINLSYLNRLSEIADDIVGYSGHERGIEVSLAAVALGAKVVERHFTHDKSQEGNDHKVSLLPAEFASMVKGIEMIERSFGTGGVRTISQGEMMNREALGKSIVAARAIEKGMIITEEMLKIRSPGKGLPPYYKRDIVGKVAKRDIEENDFFFSSDISQSKAVPRSYKFQSRFGLPVRYHDFDNMIRNTNLKFVEFHLSYKDLELDIPDFFKLDQYDMDCLIHAPELFAGDHILDLCSSDEAYRAHSISELNRVFRISNEIKQYFANRDEDVLVVTNVGGFSTDGFFDDAEKERRINTLLHSLEELDMKGVEMLPQTMPPFPWHFGGQQYHNLFVSPQETARFCSENNIRICLDTSHSALACNFMKLDFNEMVELMAPHTAHLHIADASGTGQEGLQIGDGDVDFRSLFKLMEAAMPEAYWLPEIWQGHKNSGEGFWFALDRLESYEL